MDVSHLILILRGLSPPLLLPLSLPGEEESFELVLGDGSLEWDPFRRSWLLGTWFWGMLWIFWTFRGRLFDFSSWRRRRRFPSFCCGGILSVYLYGIFFPIHLMKRIFWVGSRVYYLLRVRPWIYMFFWMCTDQFWFGRTIAGGVNLWKIASLLAQWVYSQISSWFHLLYHKYH